MNYRQIISIIVCIVMLFCFSACQAQTSDEDTQCWMPFGLQFGMTYDEFSKQLSSHGINVPALKPADSNAGFLTDGIDLDVNDSTVWEFLDSPTMKKLAEEEIELMDESGLWMADSDYGSSRPTVYFSFNQDQELYEFYCFWSCYLGSFPSSVIPEIITNYNTKLGAAQSTSDSSGMWNTEEHRVSLDFISLDSRMTLVHHCYTYDLDS